MNTFIAGLPNKRHSTDLTEFINIYNTTSNNGKIQLINYLKNEKFLSPYCINYLLQEKFFNNYDMIWTYLVNLFDTNIRGKSHNKDLSHIYSHGFTISKCEFLCGGKIHDFNHSVVLDDLISNITLDTYEIQNIMIEKLEDNDWREYLSACLNVDEDDLQITLEGITDAAYIHDIYYDFFE